MVRTIKSTVIALLMAFAMIAMPFQIARSQTRDKVIRITQGITITGQIQKPQAIYVLSRSPLNYQDLQIKEDFVKKVIQAVKYKPF
jgi:hypothetical protein